MRSVVEVNPKHKGDYLMIENISLQNFRCFERAELHDLKRINILVGENASGKTALLEGLFLAAGGSPELALRLRTWRAMGDIEVKMERGAYESLWRDMFFAFDQARDIVISLTGSPESTRTIRIFFSAKSAITIPLGTQKGGTQHTTIFPIIFESTDFEGKKTRLEVEFQEDKMIIPSALEEHAMRVAFFPSGVKANAAEAASRFSALSKKNKEAEVIERVQLLFKFIKGLSVETYGPSFSIYSSVTGVPEKMPVPLISEGVYKITGLLLAIANLRHGVMIVDEIENGFYYKIMPEIWRALHEFAVNYDTQLFVSTHSLECLTAAADFAEGKEEDFSLIRTVKENGSSTVKQVSGLGFRGAINGELEIR